MRLAPDDFLAAASALLGEPNGRCSARGEVRWRTKGALAADPARGVWFDHETGEGGDIIDLVRYAGVASDFAEAKQWLHCRGWTDGRSTPFQARDHAAATNNRPLAQSIWLQTRELTGTLGEKYLLNRAIKPPWPDSLRFHPRVWCKEVGRHLPALICAVTPLDAPDDPHAIQRIWLAEPGQKALLSAPKKSLGTLEHGGVILAPFRSRLLVAEGVETALSADERWGTSAVAALGAANMATLDIPRCVEDVLIAFDRDTNGAGESAARALAARLYAQGRVATLVAPPAGFKDWNDAALSLINEHDRG